MKLSPSARRRPDPDDPISECQNDLHAQYHELLAEVSRLDALWLLEDRIRFALRNQGLP